MKTKFERRIAFDQSHIVPRKYKSLQNLPHWHREHELIFVEQGEATVMTNGNSFTLQTGMCAFLHSEDIHNILAERDAVTVVAKLDAAYFDKLIGTKRLESPVLSGTYTMADFFEELFSELKGQKEYCGVIADSMATRQIATVFREEAVREVDSAARESAEKYKSLLDLIAKDYAFITFDDAASYMHFSRPYFSKYFYQHTGMTFTRYLNMIRISYAAELVMEGKRTVTEISQSCGFNTIRNFNRVFKELTGYPPTRLPKRFRFLQNLKEYADSGFDPTLNCTEILDA